MAENNVKTIRVYAKEYNKKDGKGTFFGFFRVNIKGEFTHQVKCTKIAGTLPISERGYYQIDVLPENVSIQKAKEENFKPVMWLKAFANVHRDVDYEAKLKAQAQAEVDDILEDLPF